MDNNKIIKEAEEYKGYSKKRLKKVIATYKFFQLLNDDTLNFVFSFVLVLLPQVLLFGFTIGVIIISILFHFLFVWKIVIKKYNFKLIKDNERKEIDGVLSILNDYLKS
jgi:hypothetical protein